MATRIEEGGFRIRRRTPGYGNGEVNMRISPPGHEDARIWEGILMDAYDRGLFVVVDALRSRELAFPEVIEARGTGGWPAVLRALEAKREEQHTEPDPVGLLDEYSEAMREEVKAKTLKTYLSHVTSFISWLAQRHGTPVPWSSWSLESLQQYRNEHIANGLQRELAKLAPQWTRDGLSEAERAQRVEALRGAKRATANRHVNSVGAFSTWLLRHRPGVISQSPAVGVRWTTREENTSRRRTYRYLNTKLLQTLLAHADEFDAANPRPSGTCAPDALFLRFLVATGATTQNEGCSWVPEYLHMDQEEDGMVPCYLHGTKADTRARDVYIPVELAQELLTRQVELGLADDRPLFPFTHDEYLNYYAGPKSGETRAGGVLGLIREKKPEGWERLARTRPYDLRHTFAVNAVMSGVDIVSLRDLMGHASVKTTEIYAKHQRSPAKALRRMSRRLGLVPEDPGSLNTGG